MSQDYAVAITARERAELVPVPRDETPLGPLEVAGPTLVSLISAGTELNWCYLGESFPTYPGYAAIFRVEQVGAEVTGLQPGDVAFCMGGHRSYQRTQQSRAVRVPPALSPAVAAFGRMMCVTMSTLTTTAARPPQQVLVTGLGLVGHLAAKMFAACGYRVVACDPSGARREIAEQAGIAPVLAAVPVDDPSVAGHVALVLECSGTEQAALDGCRVIRKGGEVVLVGTPWRRYTDLTAFDITHAIFHKYAVVRSGWEWEVPLDEQEFRPNSLYGNIAAAMEWLAEGRVAVDRLYQAVPASDAQSAYQGLLHGTWPKLAAVLEWQ